MKKEYIIFLSCLLIALSWFLPVRAQAPDFIWATQGQGQAPANTYDSGRAIAHDSQGNSYITGTFTDSITFVNTTLKGNGADDIFIAKYDASGNVVWAKRAGGTGSDYGNAITVDGSGNIYVTGYFEGAATFSVNPAVSLSSNGLSDIFIAKYDASGNLLWAKKAGGTSYDRGFAIAVDGTGNCYVTGDFSATATFYGSPNVSLTSSSVSYHDVFVAKYNASGNMLWVKKGGGTGNDYSQGITVDGSGNCFVTGGFNGTATFSNVTLTSNQGLDIFVAKYDTSGNLLWVKKAGGAGTDSGNGIAVDAAGSSYVTGFFSGGIFYGNPNIIPANNGYSDAFIAKFDASGNVLWVQNIGGTGNDYGQSIALDGSGKSYITGYFTGTAGVNGSATMLYSNGNNDIFMASYDASGNPLWAKKAGGTGNDYGYGIAADAAGNSFTTGSFTGTATFDTNSLITNTTSDVFITKYDASSAVLWLKRAAGLTSNDYGRSIARDQQGNTYVTGYFEGNFTIGNTTLVGNVGNNIYIAKYDPAGNAIWAKKVGNVGSGEGFGIAVDGSGSCYVTGYFTNTVTFYGSTDITLTSNGQSDIFLAKFDGSGNVLWAKKAGGTDYDSGIGITVDASGNSYITGYFNFTATFYGSPNISLTCTGLSDIFVAKYDASGNVLWAKKAGESSYESGRSIVLDASGNCYVAGYYQGNAVFYGNPNITLTGSSYEDIFLAKYSNSGDVIWVKRAGSSSASGDVCFGLAIDIGNNCYLTGYFSGFATFYGGANVMLSSTGGKDIFIARYNATGNLLWAKKAGGTGDDYGYSIAVDSIGNSYVTGQFQGAATFNGTPNISLTSNGSSDIFIAKYNGSGNVVWVKKVGGNRDDGGQGIVIDGSGNAYVTGFFQKTSSFSNMVLNSRGNELFIGKLAGTAGQLGISEIRPGKNETVLKIYPNPTNGAFRLQLSGINADKAEVVVTDLAGKIALQDKITLNQDGKSEMVALKATKGIYFVQVKTDQQTFVRKVIVE